MGRAEADRSPAGTQPEVAGRTIGLLCGGGLLPIRVAQSLRRRGAEVAAVAIRGDADPEVEEAADRVTWTSLARLGKWIRLFRSAGVDALLMCGSINKGRMFGSKAALLADLRSLKLWYQQTASKQDHSILGAVADEFEKEGIPVGNVPDYCPELLARPGSFGSRELTDEQRRDVRFAWPILKQVAALQIGQCVVAKEQAVVAVEAIEGTDEALRRGGSLAGGGAVAVKVPKEGHDVRFDVPCIGPDTVGTLQEAGIAALAVEAGRTIALDPERIGQRADQAGVCVVAVEAQRMPAEPIL